MNSFLTMAEENKTEETDLKEKEEEKVEEQPIKEMRAIVLSSFGGLKSVKIMKKPEPSPADSEVLIRVKAW